MSGVCNLKRWKLAKQLSAQQWFVKRGRTSGILKQITLSKLTRKENTTEVGIPLYYNVNSHASSIILQGCNNFCMFTITTFIRQLLPFNIGRSHYVHISVHEYFMNSVGTLHTTKNFYKLYCSRYFLMNIFLSILKRCCLFVFSIWKTPNNSFCRIFCIVNVTIR